MVAALVKGKYVEIENLNQFRLAILEFIQAQEALVLIGQNGKLYEIPPATTMTNEQSREERS